MAKIKYNTCDVCGNPLRTDIRFRGFIDGRRIWNRIFGGIDICYDCMSKIKQLSIDKDIESKCWDLIFKENRKYFDDDKQSAYYQGVEDCLANLSHHKLRDIK